MGSALLRCWIDVAHVPPTNIHIYEPVQERAATIAAKNGCIAHASPLDVAKHADVLVIAVKPDTIHSLLDSIRPVYDAARHLVISIAAGTTIASIAAHLPQEARVVRVMPNVNCLVGASSSAFSLHANCTAQDAKTVSFLFEAAGKAFEMPEKQMDAVTGLSGSGPAYVCAFIEALADGGVRSGLPRDAALGMAIQTVLGTAKMLLETGQHPGVLKDSVCSSGGTTITGLHELERGAMRGTVMNAVLAATERSREFGVAAAQAGKK
jgi:pyrroline-5-carboxylate reductase